MRFVCPQCRQHLEPQQHGYSCFACDRTYPVICGIPDLRLYPDPYISLEDDRSKGEMLHAAISGMTFADAVRYYYAITPEDPADLAAIWTARALVEVEIAGQILTYAPSHHGNLLDVGCSTGAALIAAGGGTGVDVAFRWLVLGQLRLREAGVNATLVCANAEHLPFPDGVFSRVTSFDTLEHLSDAKAGLQEMRRVGRTLLLTSNNRWAPLPEPHVHLWGVAWLPRRLQKGYVAWRRGDLHPYRIALRGPREGAALAREAGWREVQVEAAPIFAPQLGPKAQSMLSAYLSVRRLPGLRLVAPRWMLRAS